jgi:hypothetical protein
MAMKHPSHAMFRSFFRQFGAILFACLVAFAAPPAAVAAELIMFERSGCVWCKRWDQEVGKVYPLTSEGKLAPLRKVNIDRGVPTEYRLSPPVFYSPTFVLIADGKEIGRITGYSGDDAFWGLMSRMTKELAP